MDYFRLDKLTKSIMIITDLTYVHMFLVKGENRGIIVDTENNTIRPLKVL